MTVTRATLAVGAAALLAFLVLGTAAGALAQDTNQRPGPFMGRGGPGRMAGPGGPMGLPGPLMRQLDLSDAQQQQVRAAVESYRDELQALEERARTAREALQAAVTADAFDEGTIRARSADVAAVEADTAVLRARVHAEVMQVLTPEQRAQAKQLQDQMRDRRGEPGRGPRGPRPPR